MTETTASLAWRGVEWFVRRVTAEAVGTAFVLAAVVGPGIMGERLASGNATIALLANSIATGAALVALAHAFGPIVMGLRAIFDRPEVPQPQT